MTGSTPVLPKLIENFHFDGTIVSFLSDPLYFTSLQFLSFYMWKKFDELLKCIREKEMVRMINFLKIWCVVAGRLR